jgi:hypothetical protein
MPTPTFSDFVTQLEKRYISKSIWKTGLWVPGMFECGKFCIIVKKYGSV